MSPGADADAVSVSAGVIKPEIRSVAATQIAAILRAEGQPLYGVFDAARDEAVLRLLREGKGEHRSLYNGRRGENLAAVAPYLVALPPEGELLDQLIAEGWGKSWGVFLTSALPFDDVRRHLRRFLVVEAEDGATFYFRFYDPRVLRPYLSSCTADEIDHLFGPITALWLEGRSPAELVRFERPRPDVGSDQRSLPVIRDAQIEVLSSERAELFVERMVHRLAYDLEHDHGGRPAPDDLHGTVVASLQRAREYGLSREREQERFIALMGRLGPRFDLELPWAERILRRGDMSSKTKVEALERRAFGE
jgi:hypothetical protein